MKKPDQLQQHLQMSRMIPDLNCRYIPEEEMPCCVSSSSLGDICNRLDEPEFSFTNAVKPRASQHEYTEDSGDASVCTEEEMVAVEQLTRLKRRRINEEEDIESDSNSVNTADYDLGLVRVSSPFPSPPLLASPQATSTSLLPQISKNLQEDNNLSVSKKNEEIISLTADFDERPKPKTRTLEDVYNDTRNSQAPSIHAFHNSKVFNSRRHKAVNMVMKKT